MRKIYIRIVISLQLLCAAFFLLFRRKVTMQSKNILVVQMAKLGDMVCTTPMFRAIKEKYPESTLFVVGNEINREILRGNPHIDTYIAKERSFIKMLKILQRNDIDTVCITVPNFEFLALSIIARIPRIIVPVVHNGWSPYETFPYKLLSRFVIRMPHRMESYAPREYLRLLEPIGIYTNDTRKEIYVSGESKLQVRKFLSEQNAFKGYTQRYIGILSGAGNEIKSWAPEKFAELMNMITECDPNVTFVLLGADKDIDRTKIILNNLNDSTQVINSIGRFSIEELKACVSMLSMVIGADTGPQYIAEALSIPTIDIVGPVDEREQPPIGDIHRIVKVDRKKPELYVLNARVYNEKEALRQIHGISPDMVYREFEKLMSVLLTQN